MDLCLLIIIQEVSQVAELPQPKEYRQRKKKFNCEEKSKETDSLNRIKNKRTSLLAEKSKSILASPRANLAHNKAITLNTNGKVVKFYKIPIKTPHPLPPKPNSQGIKVSTKPELK
jgi:hypothetical protein